MEKLKEYLEIRNQNNPFADLLGIRTTEMCLGFARGEMEVKASAINSIGSIHGGCIYALADTICGSAMASHGFRAATVSGTMNYLRQGNETTKIIAEAEEIKYGKTISVYDVEIRTENSTLLAKGTFTYYNLGIPLSKENRRQDKEMRADDL